MDLIRFIKVLLKRKKLLIFIPLFGMTAAFFFTKNTPNVFKSEATISAGILDDTKISLEDDVQDKSSYIVATKFSNMMELAKSKSVIDILSYRLILHDLKEKTPFRRFNSDKYSSYNFEKIKMLVDTIENRVTNFSDSAVSPGFNKQIQSLIAEQKYDYENILKKLKVSRVGESDFIKMEFESENPELSAFALNTLVEEFIKYNKHILGEKTINSVDFFKKLAEEKKNELNKLVDDLKQYKLDNKIINLYEQTKSVVNQISDLEIIRENDNKKIPALKSALTEIKQSFKPEEKKYVEAEMAEQAKKISAVKDKINKLSAQLIEKGNNDAALKDSISTLRNSLSSAVKNMSDGLIINPNTTKQDLVQKKINYELDLSMATQNVSSEDKELRRLNNIVESFAPSEASISSFEREISVAAESYLVILNKLNLAKFAVEEAGQNIQQTETALPADKPEPNKKVLLILLIGAISFVMTVVVIFVLEYIDLTIQTPGRFKQFSGMETIGNINEIGGKSINLKEIFGAATTDPSLSYLKNSLRNLRYNLFSKVENNMVLLVSSTSEKSGKSFVATSLAFSLQLAGKKVLLIDANFKSNTITKNFGADSTTLNLLKGDNDFTSKIKKTSIAGIDVVGTELFEQTPGELINQEKFVKKLEQLKSLYDFVIIEAPAINKYTDAKELLKYSDYLLLVFSAKTILETADKNSLKYLTEESSKPVGAVLNRIDYENLEELQGEISKRRSYLRIVIKRLIKRNLGSKAPKKLEMNIS